MINDCTSYFMKGNEFVSTCVFSVLKNVHDQCFSDSWLIACVTG